MTCDVSVFSLFFTKQDFPHSDLGSKDDLEFLWANMDHIDCFTSGEAARQVTRAEKKSAVGSLEEMLPLLLTAVSQNRLTLKGLIQRVYENPLKILGLTAQPNTFVTVEVDRMVPSRTFGTPSKSQQHQPLLANLRGLVTRVVVRDETVFLDGRLCVAAGFGKEVTRDPTIPIDPLGPRVKRRKMSLIGDAMEGVISQPSSQTSVMDVQSPPPTRRFSTVETDNKAEKSRR